MIRPRAIAAFFASGLPPTTESNNGLERVLRDARLWEGEQLGVNFRRGLKRAYLVFAAVWVAYWLVALPVQKMQEDARARATLVKVCSERPDEASRQRCFDEEERASRAQGTADFFFRAYVLGPYSLLPFLAPAVLYPLLLGAMKAVSWVQRGLRET